MSNFYSSSDEDNPERYIQNLRNANNEDANSQDNEELSEDEDDVNPILLATRKQY